MWVEDHGTEWYCGVETDDGGDKAWGPFRTRAEAIGTVASVVRDAFDEEYDEAMIENRVLPDEEEPSASVVNPVTDSWTTLP